MENQDLLNRIAILEKWKEDRIRQQIIFPLDTQSQIILGKYFMHIVSKLSTVAGASGNEFNQFIGQQDQYQFILSENNLIPYTVNTTTDVFAVNANFENDMITNISTTDTAPAPLLTGVNYYVINATQTTLGTTFQLSLTSGGAAINITTVGVGSQFISTFGF